MLSILHRYVLLAALLVATTFHTADADEPVRMINVSGQGTAAAVPDMATIQTGVVTYAPLAADAMEQNNQITERLMAELKNMQVAEKDIQTSQFNVQPEHDRGERGQRKPDVVGYRVTNQLRVRVRDLAKLGSLLDALIRSGSNQVSGISFGVDDTTTVLNAARTKAVADAMARAQLYADSAGVSVGKVLSISEHQTSVPQPRFARSMVAAASSVPVAQGEQDFTATVNVSFELVDNE